MSEQRLTLTLHDLAFAVEGDLDGVSEDGRAVIATILREDPRFADPLAELEAMARDAGVDSVLDGFEVHRQFLLAAPRSLPPLPDEW